MLSLERQTTGTKSILWAMENYHKVINHGFDFFQESKAHYYDNSLSKLLIKNNIIKKGQKHNNILEKQFVNNLISDDIEVLLNSEVLEIIRTINGWSIIFKNGTYKILINTLKAAILGSIAKKIVTDVGDPS